MKNIRFRAILDLTGRLRKNLPLPIELLVSVPFPTGEWVTGVVMTGADGNPALVVGNEVIRYYDILHKYGHLNTEVSSIDDPLLTLEEVTIYSLLGVYPMGEVAWEVDDTDQNDPYGIAFLKKHHKNDPLALLWVKQQEQLGEKDVNL